MKVWSISTVSPKACTKSLASERSRDIAFTALVPWFQIQTWTQTLALTLTNAPNHTKTLTRSQTLARPRNESFFPFSRALVTWSPKRIFSLITPQGFFGISVEKYVGVYLEISKNTQIFKILGLSHLRTIFPKSSNTICLHLECIFTQIWRRVINSFRNTDKQILKGYLIVWRKTILCVWTVFHHVYIVYRYA